MKTLLQKLVSIVLFVSIYFTNQHLHAQACGAGFSYAAINWDMQYFTPDTTYSTSINYAFGSNVMQFKSTGTNTFRGTTAEHTGEGTSFGKGNDLKYLVGNGADTLIFDKEVSNLQFSIYDIDNGQQVVVTGKNAAGTAQTLTVAKDSAASTTLSVGLSGGSTVATATATAANVNLTARGATANFTIAGPVKTVTLTFTKSSGTDSIYISDIAACNDTLKAKKFAKNYQAVSAPESGQPTYMLASVGDSIVAINKTTNVATLLYEASADGLSLISANGLPPSINSLAYDPYNQIIYFADNARTPLSKSIYKYDVKTGVRSTFVADVQTLGITLFSFGMGSGGASFYDGDLYIGQDMGLTRNEPVTVYRIDIDTTTGAATKASRVWSHQGCSGSTGYYDWSDFVINNGVFYNFNFQTTGPTNSSIEHISLDSMKISSSYGTGTAYSQTSLDYLGNIYHVVSSGGTATYTPYNLNGTFGSATTFTGTTTIPLTDGAESFKMPYDYGDAPATYGVAYHLFNKSPKLMLGSKIDYEVANLANSGATGDDSKNTGSTNDEDGKISFPAISTAHFSYSITVNVTNTTGANAFLYGFIDFDRNGTFDTLKNERSALTTVPNGATTATMTWTGLTGGSLGSSFIRFRIGSKQAEARLPFGYASDGEVEDYTFPINQVNLPVELESFKGELQENKTTLLSWTTASELNNDHFDVQRKKQESSDWETIGKVNGNGNSNRLIKYSFTDEKPLVGENYYRLNQVDYNGKSTLSSTIMVKLDGAATTDKKDAFVLYPNPVKSEIWIKSEENISSDKTIPVDVFDISGERIYSSIMQENLQRLDLTDYQKGMYFIKIGTKTYKILKE